MTRARRGKKPSEMSFFDHLDELRVALWRALVGILVGFAVCYYFAPIFQEWLLIPFHDQTSASLALLAPTEGFVVRLKIALVAGLLATAPWTFFQIWWFVAPGLFEHERKLVLPVVLFSSLLFLAGAAFSMVVLPNATDFFLGFGTESVRNSWSLGKYVDFVLRLILAFGVVFELPLLIYFLARFGVVTPPFLRKYRKHMIIAFLVLASIITPPDIFTQLVLTLPMVVLYEGSILLAVLARRRFERRRAVIDAELAGEADEPEPASERETGASETGETVRERTAPAASDIERTGSGAEPDGGGDEPGESGADRPDDDRGETGPAPGTVRREDD
ncbi:MAG: Sec-independent protein translocase protein TatC [Calditrichaeota bacterium]|nr:Sec-independent protein translocase protein TatC [Calditrichota bacterium]